MTSAQKYRRYFILSEPGPGMEFPLVLVRHELKAAVSVVGKCQLT